VIFGGERQKISQLSSSFVWYVIKSFLELYNLSPDQTEEIETHMIFGGANLKTIPSDKHYVDSTEYFKEIFSRSHMIHCGMHFKEVPSDTHYVRWTEYFKKNKFDEKTVSINLDANLRVNKRGGFTSYIEALPGIIGIAMIKNEELD